MLLIAYSTDERLAYIGLKALEPVCKSGFSGFLVRYLGVSNVDWQRWLPRRRKLNFRSDGTIMLQIMHLVFEFTTQVNPRISFLARTNSVGNGNNGGNGEDRARTSKKSIKATYDRLPSLYSNEHEALQVGRRAFWRQNQRTGSPLESNACKREICVWLFAGRAQQVDIDRNVEAAPKGTPLYCRHVCQGKDYRPTSTRNSLRSTYRPKCAGPSKSK